jgi:hypothetical protein
MHLYTDLPIWPLPKPHYFPIPREVAVTKAKTITPKSGRLWETDLVFIEPYFYNWRQECLRNPKTNHLLRNKSPIYLVEAWRNFNGDDGPVEYVHIGWFVHPVNIQTITPAELLRRGPGPRVHGTAKLSYSGPKMTFYRTDVRPALLACWSAVSSILGKNEDFDTSGRLILRHEFFERQAATANRSTTPAELTEIADERHI